MTLAKESYSNHGTKTSSESLDKKVLFASTIEVHHGQSNCAKRHITEGFEERLLMLIESAIFIHFLILHHLCTKVGNYLDQIWKRLVTSQRRVCLPWWWGRYYGKNRIRPHIVAHGLHLNQHFCLSWCLFEFYNVSNAKNANTTNTGWPRPYFSISNHKYWEMVHFFWIVASLNWFFKAIFDFAPCTSYK